MYRKELVLEQRFDDLEERVQRLEVALRGLGDAIPQDDEGPPWANALPHRSWASLRCTCWPKYRTRDEIPPAKQGWQIVEHRGEFWPVNPKCPHADIHTEAVESAGTR